MPIDFKNIFKSLTSGGSGEKYMYTDPEINEQEKIVEALRLSGVDPSVIAVQESQLEKMRSRKQQPKTEADFLTSLDFLKERAPAFAAGIDTPQPSNMVTAAPTPAKAIPPTSVAAEPKTVAPESMPVDVNDDQERRRALDEELKKRQKFGLPHILASLSDAASASGKSFGTTPTKNLQDLEKKIETKGKERKENLEEQILNDPNSSASKVAQQAAARLLRKDPSELASMSMVQINKNFPIWKEAINNEEARELKRLQMEFMKQQKEISIGEKTEQFSEKQIQQIRQNLTGSDAFKNMQTIDYNARLVEDSMREPGAYGDLAAMFAFMKALDPTSVVREGEQERFQSTASLPTGMANTLNKWATGKTLQPSQRKEVADFTNKMREHKIEAYKQYNKPALEQAKRLGYNLSEIDPLFEERKAEPSGTKKTVIKIDPRTKKRYEVDPETKQVLREVI